MIVEVSHRHREVDVDLGDGVTVTLDWDEVALITAPPGERPQA